MRWASLSNIINRVNKRRLAQDCKLQIQYCTSMMEANIVGLHEHNLNLAALRGTEVQAAPITIFGSPSRPSGTGPNSVAG